MEINYISYNYKDRKEPVAFLLKGLLTQMTGRTYCTFYDSSNMLKEENPVPDNIELNLKDSKTFGCYSDPLSVAMLQSLTETISNLMKTEVLPSYVYNRVYTKGSRLSSHRDRDSCEISVTVSLYDSNESAVQNLYLSDKDEKEADPEDIVAIPMALGDALVFFGSSSAEGGLFHWRDTLESDFVLQSFLHYVRKDGEFAENAYEWEKRK